MLKRQRTGSVVCPSCGFLVGVGDDACYNCGRRNPGMWGFTKSIRLLGKDLGFTSFVVTSCGVLYALTLLFSGNSVSSGGLSILAPDMGALFTFGASGAVPVFGLGRWWTVLSAAWLHASLLHIIFNMMAVRQLGPALAECYGPARTVIIYTVAAISGFLLSSAAYIFLPRWPLLHGSIFTVGASASIAGMIGAMLYYGQRRGSSLARSYALRNVTMIVLMGLFFQGIDNYAHLGGFAGGYLVARVLDPLKPERVEHVIIAVVCMALSLISVLVSLLTSFQYAPS